MSPGRFSHFLAIDWSGAVGAPNKGIALAICTAAGGPPVLVDRGAGWSREQVLDILLHDLPPDTLVGFDFGISLPFADCGAFFPEWDASPASASELWALVDTLCADDPHLSATSLVNHAQASRYFRRHGAGEGKFFRADGASHGRGRFRVTEQVQALMGCRPYSNFNLVGAAQVGKSSLTGMRLLNRVKGALAIWPIDPVPAQGSVICEIYTSLAALDAGRSSNRSKVRTYDELNDGLTRLGSPMVPGDGPIEDHSSDALLGAAWLRKAARDPARWHPQGLTKKIAATEGWTFGAF